ncbi:MFS transporter [Salmonella enterica subsp. enterica serovar Newport]|nr:MFS transporter [Salmonella enterica subsp. enterica serovar Newport]
MVIRMPTFVYGRGHLLIMTVALYLMQGMTVGLVSQAFPVLLRKAGTSLSLLSLFSFAALPWVGKFLWSTHVDNYYRGTLGYRRSWIIPAHGLQIILLTVLAFYSPAPQHILSLFLLIILLSSAAATLDIATHGVAAQHFHGQALVWVNAFQVTGVMCGMLLGGGGVMIIADHYSYQSAILVLAGLSLLCILPVLCWREPPVVGKQQEKAALRMFFRKANCRKLLPIALVVTGGGSVVFNLMKLILTDNYWDVAQVGVVAGGGASLMVLIGSLIAGFVLSRCSLLWVLYPGLGSILTACLLWLMFTLKVLPLASVYVWLASGIGSLGIGILSVGCFSLFMSNARLGSQPATDFSVCESLQTFSSILYSSVGIVICQWGGYSAGVSFSTLLVLLGLSVIFHQHSTLTRVYGQPDNQTDAKCRE